MVSEHMQVLLQVVLCIFLQLILLEIIIILYIDIWYYILSPNSKIDSADRRGNYDEIYDETMMKLGWRLLQNV